MSLPPSMFGGEDENERYVREEYDPEVWEDAQEALDAYHSLDEWSSGSGFTAMDFFDSMTDVRDVYYDDEGKLHFTFDFEIDTDEGAYEGTRSV